MTKTNVDCFLRYDKENDMYCFVLDNSLCVKLFDKHYKVFIHVKEHDGFEVISRHDDFNAAYREVIKLYNDIKSFGFSHSL